MKLVKMSGSMQGTHTVQSCIMSLYEAARMCHDNIYPNFKNGMEFGFQNSLEIFATAAPIAQHMAQSVSIAMGFVQGLRGFNATWLGQVG